MHVCVCIAVSEREKRSKKGSGYVQEPAREEK